MKYAPQITHILTCLQATCCSLLLQNRHFVSVRLLGPLELGMQLVDLHSENSALYHYQKDGQELECTAWLYFWRRN